MAWPQLDDFRWAIQEPANCFSDPELQSGEVVCDLYGIPKMASGNFACVYEIHSNNRRWAVRTFNHEVTDQKSRYQLVSEHLDVVGLPYMVRFQFQPQGVQVGGVWYPIVKMAWVEGMTLTRWVKENREHPDKLRYLAKDWRGMIGALYGLQVAHADIQQGNVLVTKNDEFRLVDYDGMFVPTMHGKTAPELGHPNWNHPRRAPDTFGPYLDQFPGLVGYLSLLSIASKPELLDEFCNDENLILSQFDFAAPRNSAAIHQLKMIDENGVKELTEALITWCERDVDYDTLENIATGGVGPPLMRRGLHSPASQGDISPKTSAEAPTSTKKWVPYLAAGVLAVAAGAWFLQSGTGNSPEAPAQGPPGAGTTEVTGQSAPDLPLKAQGDGSVVQPTDIGQASKARPPAGTAIEDEIQERTTVPKAQWPTPAPTTSTPTVQPRPGGLSAPSAPTETFEFSNPGDYLQRGKKRSEERDWVGAEADFSKAISMNGGDPLFYRERGNVRLRKDDLVGAKIDYDKAIELDPRFSAAYNSRGVLRRRQGDMAGARADYDRAIALNPVEATYFRNRANLRRQQGDLKGSIEDYDQTVSLDGKDSVAYNSRGVVREARGDLQGARADYDKAIELNPTEPSFFQNRSNLRRSQGDLKGAQTDLDRAVALRSK